MRWIVNMGFRKTSDHSSFMVEWNSRFHTLFYYSNCTQFLLCLTCLFPDPFWPQITSCLRDNLLKNLPFNSRHQEALEVFFLLPECPVMHDSNNWESLVVPFAEAICKMNDQMSGVLGKMDVLHLKIHDNHLNGNTCLAKLQQILGR